MPARSSSALSRARWAGLIAVLAAHAVLLAALLSYAPARHALAQALPIRVTFVSPPQDPDPPPKPKPKPRVRPPEPSPAPLAEPVEPPPVLVAAPTPVPAPTPYVAPPPPPEPLPAPPVVAAPVAIAPPAPPPPVVPPRFDAAYLENPAPAYPSLSRRLREQGRVLLRVLVTPAGAAQRIELRASSGSSRLDDAALDTVRRWRFVPARQGGEAVSAWVLVPISFSLEG